MPSIKRIKELARDAVEMTDDFNRFPSTEISFDALLYGYLRGKLDVSVRRQHRIYYGNGKYPKRIDYRIGGSNPIVLELAVRPGAGGVQLNAKENKSELRKLCRVPSSEARKRVLLLVDRYYEPLDMSSLKSSYSEINGGPGNFNCYSVRVIYVHTEEDFDFVWRPR